MTSELIPRAIGSDLSRPARRASRTITQYQLNGQVRMAGIDCDTDAAIAKIENFTMATGTGMSSVVRVAQARRHLEQLAPEAAGDMAYLAGNHVLGVDEMLADLRRGLRRW